MVFEFSAKKGLIISRNFRLGFLPLNGDYHVLYGWKIEANGALYGLEGLLEAQGNALGGEQDAGRKVHVGRVSLDEEGAHACLPGDSPVVPKLLRAQDQLVHHRFDGFAHGGVAGDKALLACQPVVCIVGEEEDYLGLPIVHKQEEDKGEKQDEQEGASPDEGRSVTLEEAAYGNQALLRESTGAVEEGDKITYPIIDTLSHLLQVLVAQEKPRLMPIGHEAQLDKHRRHLGVAHDEP